MLLLNQNYMNNQIQQRTNNKLKQNQKLGKHQTIINKRVYQVMTDVFSPSVFLGTEWLINQLIKNIDQLQIKDFENKKYLQIGTGCGCGIVQILLNKSYKFDVVFGTDINQQAVQNTLINIKSYQNQIDLQKLQAKRLVILKSDVFDSIEKELKFDIIYWNFPFHPTQKTQKQLSKIQLGVRNPQYKSLKKLLSQLKQRMNHQGRLYLGFSKTMGDVSQLQSICKENGLKLKQSGMMKQGGTIVMFQLSF